MSLTADVLITMEIAMTLQERCGGRALLVGTARKVREESGVEVRTPQLDITRKDLIEQIDIVVDGTERLPRAHRRWRRQ